MGEPISDGGCGNGKASPNNMPLSRLAQNAVFLLSFAAFCWGGNAVAGKLAVGQISPLLLTFARWFVAAIVLVVLARHHLKADWPVIRQNLPYLFAMGAIGFAAFNGLFYVALLFTTAINVSILQAAMPMFIFGLNFAVFHARPHPMQIVGYSLTLTGVMVTATAGDLAALAQLAVNRGDLIMLAAALVYSAYSVALRLKPGMHWLSFLTVLVIAAATFSAALAAYEATTDGFVPPTTVTGWMVIIYTAIFASILAQGCYIQGVDLLGGNRAALFLNLVPIFGALLSILLIGETLHFYHVVALILVIGGIFVAQRLGSV